jgi:uncharacterized protein DUF4406
MNVYIAGPMTGYPRYNFPAFDNAQIRWSEAGHQVTTPAGITRQYWIEQFGRTFSPDRDRCDYGSREMCDLLTRDLAAVCRADAIVLLPGWAGSKGCAVELATAKLLGKRVIIDDMLEPRAAAPASPPGAPTPREGGGER